MPYIMWRISVPKPAEQRFRSSVFPAASLLKRSWGGLISFSPSFAPKSRIYSQNCGSTWNWDMNTSKRSRVTNRRLIELTWRTKLPLAYQHGTPFEGSEDSRTICGNGVLSPLSPCVLAQVLCAATKTLTVSTCCTSLRSRMSCRSSPGELS